MSKTSAASSIKAEVKEYWKRFAALVIALASRYRDDPFFHTEVNVIGLQIAFALVILGLVGASFTLLYHGITTAIVDAMRASADSPATLGPALVSEIQKVKSDNLATIVAVIGIATVLFGYIIARVTLAPARNALAAQKQFIGNIAHEIRTPLSVIKTNTEVALLDSDVTADMRETLASNIEELDRVSEIINNLLSLSALVKPERMEFAAVDLCAIVSDTVQKFSQLAKRNNQQITVRKSPESVVWGNSTALQQVVGNLLKNAISYTPEGGHVRITIEPAQNNFIELLVQDSGIGIARKDLFRIFEPFYRADPSRTKGSQAGSGLGLAIVSELVKMHQGRITIRSAIGRGTTVAVLLPGVRKAPQVGTEAAPRDALNEVAVDFSRR